MSNENSLHPSLNDNSRDLDSHALQWKRSEEMTLTSCGESLNTDVAIQIPSSIQDLSTTSISQPSETRVYQRLHGNRTTMTVRILPEIKEAFTRRTRELGLSTCHVAEGLISGWLYGVEQKTELVHQSPTINMTLVREVKRVRRYSMEEVDVASFKTVGELKCAVCGKVAAVQAISADGSQLLCDADFRKAKCQASKLRGWRYLSDEG